ncbi:MAG: FAD-dependent monooxygenase [Hyphomonadaceae bacterium]|jgi:2-polyprenyl-6-methoxyphenol hydroxylase-like FAD-dependent oxidoreductase|nr:FAD-dependent monooxygenase [Hyphomonadaceae bacterium]
MSGLLSALLLRRSGWRVDVYERASAALIGRGAGIMTHPELRSALSDLGLDTTRDFGVPIEGRLALDAAGRIVGRKPMPQIATSWNHLFAMLMGALGHAHYHLGKDLLRVSQGEDGVTAHFADGTSHTADLLIGADGFRSAVRAQYLPEAQPRYAGYVAWRGLADERVVKPVLTQEVFERLSFSLPPGEQFLGYPVAGPGNDLRIGHRSWNVVWYRPAEAAHEVQRLLTDDTGRVHEVSIPPPLVAKSVVEEMRSAAARLLPPQFRAALHLIVEPFLQPIYDLESPRMAFGRVALAGDAAFVVRPHVAAGVIKGVQDAATLVAALDEHCTIDTGLRTYEARRLAMGRRYVAQARRLGSYLKYSFESEEERAKAAFHARPEQVLTETAVLDFLQTP